MRVPSDVACETQKLRGAKLKLTRLIDLFKPSNTEPCTRLCRTIIVTRTGITLWYAGMPGTTTAVRASAAWRGTEHASRELTPRTRVAFGSRSCSYIDRQMLFYRRSSSGVSSCSTTAVWSCSRYAGRGDAMYRLDPDPPAEDAPTTASLIDRPVREREQIIHRDRLDPNSIYPGPSPPRA